jgi:hypothetical protein
VSIPTVANTRTSAPTAAIADRPIVDLLRGTRSLRRSTRIGNGDQSVGNSLPQKRHTLAARMVPTRIPGLRRSEPSFRRDLAVNAAAGLLHGVAREQTSLSRHSRTV